MPDPLGHGAVRRGSAHEDPTAPDGRGVPDYLGSLPIQGSIPPPATSRLRSASTQRSHRCSAAARARRVTAPNRHLAVAQPSSASPSRRGEPINPSNGPINPDKRSILWHERSFQNGVFPRHSYPSCELGHTDARFSASDHARSFSGLDPPRSQPAEVIAHKKLIKKLISLE